MSGEGMALTRRGFQGGIAGLGALGLFGLPGAGHAAEAVDRKDIFIIEAWPPGPTYKNYANCNPFAFGNDLRNHIAFVYEALFFWNNLKSEHIPFLASGYSFNDDFTVATVKLRDGIAWADGKPFSADDVVHTFEILRQSGEGKKDLYLAADVGVSLKATEKVDDHTVRFVLKTRDPRFVLRILTVKFNTGIFILPKHILDSVEDVAGFTNFDLAKGLPVGTGPYRIVDAAPERIIMDRRDDWWGADPARWAGQQGVYWAKLPAPKRLITVPRNEQQQSAQQLAADQIDWMVEAPVPMMKQLLAKYPAISTLTDRKAPWGYTDWWPTSVYFNFDSPKVQDLRVRQALRHTINPKQVIDIFHEGAADQSFTPFPDFPVLHPYLVDVQEVAKSKALNTFDPKAAAALMQDAGFAKDSDGFWAKDGTRLQLDFTAASALDAMAPIVAQQMRRGGFDVSYTRRADYAQVIYSGKTDVVLFGHLGGIFDPQDTMLLYHSKFYRPVGEITTRFHRWRNKRFDELTDQVGVLPVNDPALRPLVKEAFTLWMDDVVEIPIAQWYHRVPWNTTLWKGWPTEANPYQSPTVSYWTTIMVVHGVEKA
jgi:peptide/nickel transport system substrate-binding protein